MTASRTGLAVRRLMAIAISAITASVVCACGSSGDDAPGGNSSSPSAAESTPTTEAPAGSQVAEINGAQLDVPSDWKVEDAGARVNVSAPKDEAGYSPGFAVFNADITLAENVEEFAVSRLKAEGPEANRLPDVKYAGVTFFHIREADDTNTFETYGTVVGDSEATVAWTFINEFASRKQMDQLINQVMPTFKFNG